MVAMRYEAFVKKNREYELLSIEEIRSLAEKAGHPLSKDTFISWGKKGFPKAIRITEGHGKGVIGYYPRFVVDGIVAVKERMKTGLSLDDSITRARMEMKQNLKKEGFHEPFLLFIYLEQHAVFLVYERGAYNIRTLDEDDPTIVDKYSDTLAEANDLADKIVSMKAKLGSEMVGLLEDARMVKIFEWARMEFLDKKRPRRG